MLNTKFNEVMQNLEKNIDSEKDLNYVKQQITELTMTYLKELGNVENIYNKSFKNVYKKISELEKTIEKINNEYENNEIDVEPIQCPYCNENFLIEYDSNNIEVKCPECKNIIELDWNNESDEDM